MSLAPNPAVKPVIAPPASPVILGHDRGQQTPGTLEIDVTLFSLPRRRSTLLSGALVATLMASTAHATNSGQAVTDAQCTALTTLTLKDTQITSATPVAAGAGTGLYVRDAKSLPAFCRVVAHVRSDPGSDIGVEIWLPLAGWAGTFHGTGNGGFAGTLAAGHATMASGLRKGFVSAVTDTGTAPATMLDGDPLIGQPRKWKDWGKLSTHVMTVTGKAVAQAFYGRSASRSYYTGCSTGGQQGLIEALHYPEDYDGILVTAPVINRVWGHAAVLANFSAAHRSATSRLTDASLALLNRAALKACGGKRGGLAGDPFIAEPFGCRFDPAVLQCRSGASDQCLTADQVATARAFYTGPTDAKGRPRFYGWLPGSEAPGTYGWAFLQAPQKEQPPFSALFKWVFGANWDWRGFDFAADLARVDTALGADLNDATRGSLDAFRARGGKLILAHGLSDSLVPPGQSVDFYHRHAREQGGIARTRSFARMFLAPGMMHCGGGTGPDSFNVSLGAPQLPPSGDASHDLFAALIDWREQGKAPDRVIATRHAAPGDPTIAMQRPICAYPQRAIYKGRGPNGRASSFTCVTKPTVKPR